MRLSQLTVCSLVGCIVLSFGTAAIAKPKSPMRAAPLAAPHHGSYPHRNATPVAKVVVKAPKKHFWNR